MAVDINNMTDEEFEEYMRNADDEVETTEEETEVDESTDIVDNEDDTLEQPDEDSDEQTDTDSEEDIDDNDGEGESDDDTEEDSDTDELTGEAGEEQPTEVNTEDNNEPQTYKVRADGQDFDLTVDELLKLAPKAFNYVKKTQELAPWRKQISAMQEAEIDADKLNMLISAYKGDKGAIAELFKTNGLDPLELDTEENTYIPTKYGKSDVELDLQEVINTISKDPEYERTQRVLSSEWDDNSWNELVNSVQDPKKRLRDGSTYIEGLHRDIRSGMYDEIAPIMKKMKIFGNSGKSDLDLYIEASKVYFDNIKQQQTAQANKAVEDNKRIDAVKSQSKKREAVKSESSKRKAAAPVKTNAGKRGIMDYLDEMNDEDFEKEMEKILKEK